VPTQTPAQTPVQKPPAPPAATTTTTRAPRVRPATRVTVSPASGRAGTTVTVVADVRGTCDPAWTFFQDRTQVGNLRATRPVIIGRWNGRRLVASYTVSSRDAVGRGRFGISCDMRTDTYRVDYTSFKVLPAGSDAVTGTRAGGKGNGGAAAPLPDQAGTEQVGAELGAGAGGGLDPVWLLLPTALLLVVLAVVLRLLRTARPQH
jgi:hypothetical protein